MGVGKSTAANKPTNVNFLIEREMCSSMPRAACGAYMNSPGFVKERLLRKWMSSNPDIVHRVTKSAAAAIAEEAKSLHVHEVRRTSLESGVRISRIIITEYLSTMDEETANLVYSLRDIVANEVKAFMDPLYASGNMDIHLENLRIRLDEVLDIKHRSGKLLEILEMVRDSFVKSLAYAMSDSRSRHRVMSAAAALSAEITVPNWNSTIMYKFNPVVSSDGSQITVDLDSTRMLASALVDRTLQGTKLKKQDMERARKIDLEKIESKLQELKISLPVNVIAADMAASSI